MLLRRLIFICALWLVGRQPTAALGECDTPAGCCTRDTCPTLVCRPVWKIVPIKKTCFLLERQEICVPKVTLPWESCCGGAKCGRVITVNTLEEHQLECGAKRICKWHIEPASCQGHNKPDGCHARQQTIPDAPSVNEPPLRLPPGPGASRRFPGIVR